MPNETTLTTADDIVYAKIIEDDLLYEQWYEQWVEAARIFGWDSANPVPWLEREIKKAKNRSVA